MSSNRPFSEGASSTEEAPLHQDGSSANTRSDSTSAESPLTVEKVEDAAQGDGAERARRRVQLNPVADPSQIKAVPMRGISPPPPPSAGKPEPIAAQPPASPAEAAAPTAPAAPEQGESKTVAHAPEAVTEEDEQNVDSAISVTAKAAEETAPVAPVIPAQPACRSRAPVEIPSADDLLDADLEAEIAAALKSEELAVVPVVSEQAEEATEETPQTEESLEEGTRLTGTVQSVHGDNVFVDLGFRAPGVLQLRQFESATPPQVGTQLKVLVSRFDPAEGLILLNLPRARQRVSGNWDEVSAGQTVDCMVTKTNKGGLEVKVGSLRGFLPAGQVDLGFVSDLEPFVGQKLRVKIIEANRHKRNLIVSRRACLELERKETEEELWNSLALGQQFSGRVKTIKNYGVFVDIGGVDGFLHIGEISWSRINHPSEVLHEGQQVDVKVVSLDPEKKRIGLGMKQLEQNPWTNAAEKYATGKTVSGKVTRAAEFGAFVELEPGLEGLIHISELDYRRVNKVTDVLQVGQEIDVQVLEVDPDRKRIGLSLKALKPKPETPAPVKKSDEDLAPGGGEEYMRKRKGNLKGGTGTPRAGGGLFGNPKDFG